MGELEYGTDPERVVAPSRARSAAVRDQGVEVAIVVGAGNIYRGMKGAAAGHGPRDRPTTWGCSRRVLNALPLQDALEKIGTDTRVQSALGDLRGGRALHPPARDAPPREGPGRDLRGGHRQPVLHDRHGRRAARRGDPRRDHPDGQERGGGGLHAPTRRSTRAREFIPEITHMEAIERRLRVMDSTALALCMENGMPINVFNMDDDTQPRADNLRRARGHARIDSGGRGRVAAENLIDELLKDAGERMAQIAGVRPARVLDGPHRPREPVAAGPRDGRLLRRDDAAEPALDDLRARGPPADRAALRQVLDQGDREGDQRVRRRA